MTTDPAPAVPQDTRSLNPIERAKDDALPLSVRRRLDFHRHEALTAARDAVVSAAKAWRGMSTVPFHKYTANDFEAKAKALVDAIDALNALEAEGGAAKVGGVAS